MKEPLTFAATVAAEAAAVAPTPPTLVLGSWRLALSVVVVLQGLLRMATAACEMTQSSRDKKA
jgi:hypothetical protein